MTTTQNFIPIEDIKDDLVFLKDGSVNIVITTSAVNFDLLFETEQISIIQSFAGLINSLSFPIQIVIRSRRLDVSSYLTTLDKAALTQPNPLLKQMIANYRQFAESIIKENNVLDKQFYVCINVTASELFLLTKNIKDKTKKALTVLSPRRDHLLRQLAKLGLKARQLNTTELIKLFYDIYSTDGQENIQAAQTSTLLNQVGTPKPLPQPQPATAQIPQTNPAINLRRLPQIPVRPVITAYYPTTPQGDQSFIAKTSPPPANNLYQPPISSRTSPPFIVEELPDEYGP